MQISIEWVNANIICIRNVHISFNINLIPRAWGAFLILEDSKQIFDSCNFQYQNGNIPWGWGWFNVGNFRSSLKGELL